MANGTLKEYSLRFVFRATFSAVRRKTRGILLYRVFGPLVRMHGLKASKHVDALTDAFEEFLSTGADAANQSFWRSFIRLGKLAENLPPEQRNQISLELVWRMQSVLAKETKAASALRKQALKLVDNSSALKTAVKTVAKASKGTVKLEVALVALEKLKGSVRVTNRALWAVWKRFDEVVSLDHVGVLKAMSHIAANVDKIRELLKSRAFRTLDSAHLFKVRGFLGEAYALMSKVWLKEREKLLREAEELALKRGPGWQAHYMTQLEHAIEVGGKEGPDAVVVLINHNTGEVVLHAVAQVKIEKTVSAFEQIYRDFRRLLGQGGSGAKAFADFRFKLPSGAMSEPYAIVGGATLPKTYVLSAADSAASESALGFLKAAGASITEIQLDLTINQLSRLAINSIEAILKFY